MILVERKGRTALLTLNRPKALNALSLQVMTEVVAATEALDRDPDIGCIVPTGSQRLTRAIGKAKAMEMCLTGRTMDATEAERGGHVSRVVPASDLLDEALAVAETVAGMSLPVAMMAKEAVARSFETTLTEGVRFERRLFPAVSATLGQKEGMSAFVDKRPPEFVHR
ncbi:enoyl-CoA hydratase-related protein [Streptomyces tubercidicus]|uniref:enoyl-CoA hydratase-related protein n=1 Tax=Streptomyces tubercidicus TaxID=47759 RepID=UPI002E19BFEC|nr:enoyl-CoA hydratase-related protein [Streptomyces tubercidicus]